jgi:hypothetical protein
MLVNRVASCLLAAALTTTLTGCSDTETGEPHINQPHTPQRLQPDGSIQLTDQDRAALGLLVVLANEGDLPDSALRFGHVLSTPANEGQVVAPVTGWIARAPRVQLGAAVGAA